MRTLPLRSKSVHTVLNVGRHSFESRPGTFGVSGHFKEIHASEMRLLCPSRAIGLVPPASGCGNPLQPLVPHQRQFGDIVPGAFTPVLAKHTKSFNLVDTLSVGVDRIQRNFEPMQRQVESWRQTQITDAQAKLIFYSAFVDGKLDAPKSLLPEAHRLYFEPEYPEFAFRTMWSLSNAFTSAFKKLHPVPQFKATAKLGEFLSQLPA